MEKKLYTYLFHERGTYIKPIVMGKNQGKNSQHHKKPDTPAKPPKPAPNKNLKTSKKKDKDLDALNRNFSAFTYISTHDLQEPLRKIQTFSSRIVDKEEKNLSAEGREDLARMQHAARRMQRIIDDLAMYSHITSEEKKFQHCDPEQLLEEVKTELAPLITEKKANIHFECPHKIKLIPHQFKKLMYNLLSNCLKFSEPTRTPDILIKGRVVKGNEIQEIKLKPTKKYCHFSIADNGIGFEEKYCERIFEAFQRLHSQDEYEGTGMGLAICKKIVENHAGHIRASGSISQGAVIDVYLPCQQ